MIHAVPMHERMIQALSSIGLLLFDRKDGGWVVSETGRRIAEALGDDPASPLPADGWQRVLQSAMNDHASALADHTQAAGGVALKIVP